jgi:hypothetical protein
VADGVPAAADSSEGIAGRGGGSGTVLGGFDLDAAPASKTGQRVAGAAAKANKQAARINPAAAPSRNAGARLALLVTQCSNRGGSRAGFLVFNS